MSQDRRVPDQQDDKTQSSFIIEYLKRSVVTVVAVGLIAGALFLYVKRVVNPQDNFLVIVNNTNGVISTPSLYLQQNGKTLWTVTYDAGIGSGRARAYLLPHAIIGDTLVLQTEERYHSCQLMAHGRHSNTIFMTVNDLDCSCVINAMPE